MIEKNCQEKTKFLILPALDDLEILHGTYVTHSFSKHAHDGYAIGVIEKGALKFSYRGEKWVAPRGYINLVIPGEAHDGYAASEMGWTYRMFYLKPSLLERANSEATGKPKGKPFFKTGVIKDDYLASMILNLHIMLGTPGALLIEQETYLLRLLTEFIQRHADDRTALQSCGRENQAVNQARKYIEDNFAKDISIKELSRRCQLSPYYLIRVFREKMGIPPHAYLKQVRITRAKQLFAQGLSVVDVAYQTGFADQSHFTRHFKQITGLTPGKYSNIVQELSPRRF